jgi:preprotein translocase subunit SecA
MNSQREVIYRRRRHALYGERMQVDIANMFYDTAEAIVSENQPARDFENFKLDLLRVFSMESPVDQSTFEKTKAEELVGQLHSEVLKAYTVKNEHIAEMALPVIKNVYNNQKGQYQNIVVPITDGQKAMQVVTNLEKAVSSEGRQLIRDFEKGISLGMIDDKWKEHLRDMDDLRQSVGTAQYEQKDPLLIYKFEAFELFKTMMENLNREVAAFLFKASLPAREDAAQVQQTQAPRKSAYDQMQTSHPELNTSGGGEQAQQERPKRQPVVAEKKVGRNDQVTVQNLSTGEKKEMKYKKAESLIASQKWILVS